jgi:hypothetical protein
MPRQETKNNTLAFRLVYLTFKTVTCGGRSESTSTLQNFLVRDISTSGTLPGCECVRTHERVKGTGGTQVHEVA